MPRGAVDSSMHYSARPSAIVHSAVYGTEGNSFGRYDYIPKGTFLSRKERSFREMNIFHTKGRFYSNFSGPLVEIWHRIASHKSCIMYKKTFEAV